MITAYVERPRREKLLNVVDRINTRLNEPHKNGTACMVQPRREKRLPLLNSRHFQQGRNDMIWDYGICETTETWEKYPRSRFSKYQAQRRAAQNWYGICETAETQKKRLLIVKKADFFFSRRRFERNPEKRKRKENSYLVAGTSTQNCCWIPQFQKHQKKCQTPGEPSYD